MITDLINDPKITTFTAPEKTTLTEYKRVIHGLVETSPMGEVPIDFVLNQTGNIYYASTSETVQEHTKELFDSVTVLFAAMTKALAESGKNLFDYDSWSKLIAKTGYFVEVQKFRNILDIKSGSLSIDTQIIQNLLPGLVAGNAMTIAKGVLSSLNGEFSREDMNEKTQISHILFICEELLGAASVTVRLFYASKESHKTVTSSPCHKSVSTSFEQLQEANTFLFVDPEAIAKFAKKFEELPEEYKNLIDKLKEMLDE